MPVVLKHRNYCIVSLSGLREPRWRLRTPILHWTLKLHLLETLGWYIKSIVWDDPPKKSRRLISGSQASEFPYTAIFSHTWQLFGDSWWHCPDSSCRYWCPCLNNKTEPFDSQHASINHWVNKWFVPSIRSRDGGINSNSLLWKLIISWILGWDFPIPKIPSDQIQTPLSNQHII